MKQNLFSLFIVLIFSLVAALPLFHNGFFVTDDGEWMIIRLSAFYQALADGQFPVRFLHRLNFDFGYPVATFLYPGFMYAGVVFHLLKIGFVETIKIILGLSLLGTTLFTYFWLAKLYHKRLPAVVGAFTSLYLPYHFYDVYTRGSVGEIFSFVWIPFILWMVEKKNTFFVTLGIFLLLLSHNTIALLFIPLLFIYSLLRKIISTKDLLVSFFLGISAAAFFLVPVLFELPLTRFSQILVSNPLQYFADINLIGPATLVILLFSLVLFVSRNKFPTGHKKLVVFFLVVTFLSCFFSSSLSTIFWQFIPSTFIQFPFRLLSYLIISLAFLTAFIAYEMHNIWKRIVVIGGVIAILFWSSLPFMNPTLYTNKGEGYYVTNDASTTVQDEYLPNWVKEKVFQRPTTKVQILKGEGAIRNIVSDNKLITFNIDNKETTKVRINTIYWPGWKAYIDNEKTLLSYNNPQGVMEFDVPKGSHAIRVVFGETPLRLVGDCISLFSLLILVIITVRKYKK